MTLNVTSEFLYPIAVAVSALTTLCTPYLIRSSDPLVGWFDRTAPRPLVEYLQLYGNWVRDLGSRQRGNVQVRRLMRRWALQIGLNLALISGLLIAAAWSGRRAGFWLPQMPSWTGGPKAIVWFAAIVLVLPLLIATLRKVRAISMVIAELQVRPSMAGEQTAVIRLVVADTILIAGGVGMVLWILLLTSAILPPWPMLVVLAGIIIGIAAILWQSFIRMYAKAQIALHEALTQPHPEPDEDLRPISPLLRSAHLETVELPPNSRAAGQLIRELQLRTRTGASIVGIERQGASIINPGPDDDLQGDDRVLLIGSPANIAAARAILLLDGPPRSK